MKDAFGSASRMCRAKPSTKSYWLRCASSAMTTMLRRSESTGCRSPLSSGKNFWIVVKTTPPEATAELLAKVRAALGLDRGLAQQVPAAGERAEELIVEIVAVGQDNDRGFAIGRVLRSLARRRKPLSGSCPVPCVCQTTPIRRSLGAPPDGARIRTRSASLPANYRRPAAAARRVSSTATFTAWNWW